MRKSFLFIVFALILSSIILWNCNSRNEVGPGDTIIKIYGAANDGWYSTAEQYIFSEILTNLKQNYGSLYLIDLWDIYTDFGKIKDIEVISEDVRGERADVTFRVHFQDGKTKEDHDLMFKEGQRWKILFDFQYDPAIQNSYQNRRANALSKREDK